ncbi:MAG: FHA domain-containing protein [Candidatus Dadabacteria bacterium]|nr:MAG: FHA domain-containing protein [Candidatus Dadabacteria bacterium]
MNGVRPGIPAKGVICIQVNNETHNTFEIDISVTEGYIIGRSDSKSSYIPDIDLAPFHALEQGVSRRHAALVRHQGQLHVLDLSSVNGTFLNGERLASEVPYALSSGDKLILGNLSLLITSPDQ